MDKLDKLIAKSKPSNKILIDALNLKMNRKHHHKLFHFRHHKLVRNKHKNNKSTTKKVLSLVKDNKIKKLSHKQYRIALSSLTKARKKLSKKSNNKDFAMTYLYIFKRYADTDTNGKKFLIYKKLHSYLKSMVKRVKQDN